MEVNRSLTNINKPVDLQTNISPKESENVTHLPDPSDKVDISQTQEVMIIPKMSDLKSKGITAKEVKQFVKETVTEKGGQIAEELPIVKGFTAQLDDQMIKDLQDKGFAIYSNAVTQVVDPMDDLDPFKLRDEDNAKPITKENLPKDVSLEAIKADRVLEKGFTGKGIGVVLPDSGGYPHPDLKDSFIGFVDFLSGKEALYDNFGHATAMGGLIDSSGASSGGVYRSGAPDAKILPIKIVDEKGGAKPSDAIKALDWAVKNKNKYALKVIVVALGFPALPPDIDPIDLAVKNAAKAGLIVVTSAGNSGGTIKTSPANSPYAITVAAADTKGTADISDDVPAKFSSQGPSTGNDDKPDVIAPGVGVVCLHTPSTAVDAKMKKLVGMLKLSADELKSLTRDDLLGIGVAPDVLNQDAGAIRKALMTKFAKSPVLLKRGEDYVYIVQNGTSVAAAMVGMVIAEMLEANPNLTPVQVKDILKKTADPLPGVSKAAQGAGYVNAEKAVDAAVKLMIRD